MTMLVDCQTAGNCLRVLDTGCQEPESVLDLQPLPADWNDLPAANELITALVQQAMAGFMPTQEYSGLRCSLLPGGVVQHKCAAWLPRSVAQQKLLGFIEHWHPDTIHAEEDTVLLHFDLETTLWQRLVNRRAYFEMKIGLDRKVSPPSQLAEITVQLVPSRSGDKRVEAALPHLGPVLLTSLRTYLQASPEQRIHERFPYQGIVEVVPLSATGEPGTASRCEGRDLSYSGIGLFMPCRPPTAEIRMRFPVYRSSGQPTTVEIPALIQWAQAAPDGYLVGAQFLLPSLARRSKLLLIEADLYAARSLGRMLGDARGMHFDLEHADGLAPGLKRLSEGGIDLVLLDLALPDGKGLPAFRKVRAASPGMTVVLLADATSESAALEAVHEGAADYLAKGTINADLLARTLNSVIDRQGTSDSVILKCERERALATLEDTREREHYLAYHDVLTGLPNRQQFYERLQQAIARAAHQAQMAVVLFIDLDGFKRINDTLGHSTGDKLLQAVARRLGECVRDDDTIARLGGDEFTVVFNGIRRTEDAIQLGQKMRLALARPFLVDGRELFVTASIGISLYPADGGDVETLVKRADMAMYHAKEQSKNACHLYNSSMEAAAMERLALEDGLRKALPRGELELFYQPQVELATRRVIGVEALVRWRHPELGLLLPDRFIGLAEETGQILPIGEWVLRTACAQAKAWLATGLPPLRVAINLSPRQFRHGDMGGILADALRNSQLPPKFLGLEITESGAMHDVEYTLSTLRAFKKMGVQLLIDDFGKGHSSLDYLKRFPIDVLKLDGTFLQGIPDDRSNIAIIRSVVSLAHSLGLRFVAEHVETECQSDTLRSLECDEAQGYLFAPPVPAAQVVDLCAGPGRKPG